MSDREHSAKTPSHRTGIFATLRALLRGQGSGAPSAKLLGLLAISLVPLFAFAAPASAAVQINPVSEVSYTSAQVTGKVLANEGPFGTGYSFEYSTDNQNWSPGLGGFLGAGEPFPAQVGGKLENLKGGTEYFVRLTTFESISPAPNPSFTTLAVDPPAILATDDASKVFSLSATATGEVKRPTNADPAFDVKCHFEYIPDDQYKANELGSEPLFQGAASVDCEQNPITKDSADIDGKQKVNAHLTGLTASTTYHLRLAAENGAPGVLTKDAAHTFTTAATVAKPTVLATANAAEVEYTQAQAKGEVQRPVGEDPALDTECRFEYVTDVQFGEAGFADAPQTPCADGLITEGTADGEGKQVVKATLPGLLPSTKYHLRLSASNQGGFDSKDAVATFTTAGPIPTPTVITADDATEVGIHAAKVKGKVQRPAGKDPALNVNCRFEYVTDKQFNETGFAGAPQASCGPENPITEPGVTKEVEAELGGLRADTTFHLRLAAGNDGGTDAKDAAGTFKTLPAILPTVTIDPVAGGTYTTAHVSGTVDIDDPGHSAAYAAIEVSTDNGVSWTEFIGNSVPNPGHAGVNVVERTFTGLQPNTSYSFRILATYSGAYPPDTEAIGEMAYSPEPNPSITTEPLAAPTAEDFEVTAVAGTSAHFSASVDPHAPAGPLSDLGKKAYATDWEFLCTPECPDNAGLSKGTVQGEEGAQAVSFDAKRLQPNTHYEVTLVAKDGGGLEANAGPVPFDTLLVAPTVKSTPGASDGNGGYTLQGVVTPNNNAITSCEFHWGPNSAEKPEDYAFSADCSPKPEKAPVTVEAHLTGLQPGATYHAKLVIKSSFGEDDGGDHEFVPTLDEGDACPNEQVRKENSSLALPECRAFEQVAHPSRAGLSATLFDYTDDGAVGYASEAANLVNSGQGSLDNRYTAVRSDAGWETIPNLNGPSGSIFAGADPLFSRVGFGGYSSDLRSSILIGRRASDEAISRAGNLYLHKPDGSFALIGNGKTYTGGAGEGGDTANDITIGAIAGASDNLSHVLVNGTNVIFNLWGPGVYEFVGTGNDLPQRVDLDNAGDPVSECTNQAGAVARGNGMSAAGNLIVFTANGRNGDCSTANHAVGIEGDIWARVGGVLSYKISASQCTRGDCNPPAAPNFVRMAKDGSRVFFTTTQQLLDADTDQANDLYACDIPLSGPAPIAKGNPCPSLIQVSGAHTGAAVQSVLATSEDGSTVYFVAQGVLADNEDGLDEKAVAGDHNLYVWRTDAAHPAGQTAFVARLDANDVAGTLGNPQIADDGRYLVFTTSNQLVATDTDHARDVYRYDSAAPGVMTRVSTGATGVGGNSEGLDARLTNSTKHQLHPGVSDDGEMIVFTTEEPLSPLDGNGNPDVYLWNDGRVHSISAGAGSNEVWIDGSGKDIYFNTGGQLSPSDGDTALDVYDARLGGGFSFVESSPCAGETCQPPITPQPAEKDPSSNLPGLGNPKPPKSCPKGKVRKHGKCVKKPKGPSGKKHHGKNAGHKQGGGK